MKLYIKKDKTVGLWKAEIITSDSVIYVGHYISQPTALDMGGLVWKFLSFPHIIKVPVSIPIEQADELITRMQRSIGAQYYVRLVGPGGEDHRSSLVG